MIKLERLAFLKSRKDKTRRFSLKVPSDIRHIKDISRRILDAVSKYNVSEDKVFDIRLCVEEAVRNAIVHGNNSNRKLPVKVDCVIDENSVIIGIEDRGSGFKPDAIPDPTEEANMNKNSGRGVYLIKKLMDKVEYNGLGNKVTMTKKLK